MAHGGQEFILEARGAGQFGVGGAQVRCPLRHAPLQFGHIALHLLVQAGLPQGHGDLVRDLVGDVHVFGSKAARALCPQRERADQLALGDEGHGNVRAHPRSPHSLHHQWPLCTLAQVPGVLIRPRL